MSVQLVCSECAVTCHELHDERRGSAIYQYRAERAHNVRVGEGERALHLPPETVELAFGCVGPPFEDLDGRMQLRPMLASSLLASPFASSLLASPFASSLLASASAPLASPFASSLASPVDVACSPQCRVPTLSNPRE